MTDGETRPAPSLEKENARLAGEHFELQIALQTAQAEVERLNDFNRQWQEHSARQEERIAALEGDLLQVRAEAANTMALLEEFPITVAGLEEEKKTMGRQIATLHLELDRAKTDLAAAQASLTEFRRKKRADTPAEGTTPSGGTSNPELAGVRQSGRTATPVESSREAVRRKSEPEIEVVTRTQSSPKVASGTSVPEEIEGVKIIPAKGVPDLFGGDKNR